MKNNKKILFILIPVMIMIWGMIGYQVFITVDAPEAINNLSVVPQKENSSFSDTVDFQLLLNYDDPFLSSRSNNKKSTFIKQTSPRRNNKRIKKQVSREWPDIIYGGMVKSSNNKEVALVSIDEISYIVNKGDIVRDVRILNYSASEITLKYSREKKIISK